MDDATLLEIEALKAEAQMAWAQADWDGLRDVITRIRALKSPPAETQAPLPTWSTGDTPPGDYLIREKDGRHSLWKSEHIRCPPFPNCRWLPLALLDALPVRGSTSKPSESQAPIGPGHHPLPGRVPRGGEVTDPAHGPGFSDLRKRIVDVRDDGTRMPGHRINALAECVLELCNITNSQCSQLWTRLSDTQIIPHSAQGHGHQSVTNVALPRSDYETMLRLLKASIHTITDALRSDRAMPHSTVTLCMNTRDAISDYLEQNGLG